MPSSRDYDPMPVSNALQVEASRYYKNKNDQES